MPLMNVLFHTNLTFSTKVAKKILFRCVTFLSLSNNSREFIALLVSDVEQNLMTNNRLYIHAESGNIFYQNFNTNENFYIFILAQQVETKAAIIPKGISYCYSFEKYIKKYLPSFSIYDVQKFDFFSNKNSKYLLYNFNDQIEALGGKKQIIQHTANIKDSIGIKKIEDRN